MQTSGIVPVAKGVIAFAASSTVATGVSPASEETNPVLAKKIEQVVTRTSITIQIVFLTIATSTNLMIYVCKDAGFVPT
jgi:hypothetical protein